MKLTSHLHSNTHVCRYTSITTWHRDLPFITFHLRYIWDTFTDDYTAFPKEYLRKLQQKAATNWLYLIRWSTAHGCNWHIWWWCNSSWHVATTAATQRTAHSIKAMSRSTAGCHNCTMTATKSDGGGAGSQFWPKCPRLLRVLSMPRWRDNRTMMWWWWWYGWGTMLLGQGEGRAGWPRRKLRRNLRCNHTSGNCWKMKSK